MFKKLLNKLKKYRLILLLILLLIVKIQIVKVQPIKEGYTLIYDDQLMVEQANSIVSGKWLGDYNSKTLVKGVFTPLFIALTYILNIPFLIGKEIFYGIACITFIISISKNIKNKICLILMYLIILFNPIEYSMQLCRVYRDGIYSSLILFLLSFLIEIFLNRKENAKKQIKYFIGAGLSFTSCFLCREETIWLLPFIIIITLCTIIPNYFNKKILLYLIPIAIFVISINAICLINYKNYGVYTLNQYWGKPFKSAYGALLRVKPEEEKKRVPITHETMKRLYELSPKFAELQDFLEGPRGYEWRNIGAKIDDELTGAYVQWALMDAVNSLGYYQNAKKADQYYTDLANEINELCDDGKVESRKGKIISNSCYFNLKDIMYVIGKMPKTIEFQYRLKDANMMVINTRNVISKSGQRKIFEKMTKQPIERIEHYFHGNNRIKIKIIEQVKEVYDRINPYLFYVSALCSIIFIFINIKKLKKIYEECVILLSLSILYFTRIFIITFTEEMMFAEALKVSYLACIYDIQYLFGIISIIYLIIDIKNKIKKGRNMQDNIILTILIPAKDEEDTIEIVINKAKKWIENEKINAEILVVNNNSADKTKEVALSLNVRVIDVYKEGYGNALREGIKNSKGKYIIMGDADDSYNFLELDDFFKELQNGNDLVIGNRYHNIEKGAMKWSHRYIGTPILSFWIRKKYKIQIKDVNCGLRGFNKEKIMDLSLKCEGMEFASEMIIKAKKANLKIKEIPINFHKDKRKEKSKSHLNTIRDGFRHLKVILFIN